VAATVLITGARGLIGSQLMRHWSHPGFELVPVRHADIDLLVPGAAERLVEGTRPSHVLHLAWCASGTPGYRHSTENGRWLRFSLELHEACRASGATFWATGSVVDRESRPPDAYAAAKSELRRRLRQPVEDAAIGWLRPFYVFDEQAGAPALVALALEARRRGTPIDLATPHSSHDFVHVYDVARAVEVAVTHGLTGEIPIGSGTPHRVSELVDALGVHWEPSTSPSTSATHVDEVADPTRLTVLGWAPTRTKEFFGDD
jgi:nucleoside-diphosphate-sugar epimerase